MHNYSKRLSTSLVLTLLITLNRLQKGDPLLSDLKFSFGWTDTLDIIIINYNLT